MSEKILELKTPLQHGAMTITDADGRVLAEMSRHLAMPNTTAQLLCNAFNEHAALKAQVAELTEANGRYRKALEHYADASNWDSGATQNGVRWDEALYSPLKGESERGYDIARQALHPKQEEQDAV